LAGFFKVKKKYENGLLIYSFAALADNSFPRFSKLKKQHFNFYCSLVFYLIVLRTWNPSCRNNPIQCTTLLYVVYYGCVVELLFKIIIVNIVIVRIFFNTQTVKYFYPSKCRVSRSRKNRKESQVPKSRKNTYIIF